MNKYPSKLHFEQDHNYIHYMTISLLPLILYAFYKNGILPYMNHDISLIYLLKPLLFPSIGWGSGLLSDIIYQKISHKSLKTSFYPFYGLLISLSLPVSTNLLLVFIMITAFLLLIRLTKLKISPLIWGILLINSILLYGFKINYLNPSEQNHQLVYSMMDIFLGRNIGGVGITSIFVCLISFLFLCFNFYYKKEIPLATFLSYFIIGVLLEHFYPSGDFLKTLLNSPVFYASVWVAPEIKFSPYMEKAKISYGLLIGGLGMILIRFLSKDLGFYLSIAISSLLIPGLDLLALKREEKKTTFVDSSIRKKKIRLKKKIKKEKQIV